MTYITCLSQNHVIWVTDPWVSCIKKSRFDTQNWIFQNLKVLFHNHYIKVCICVFRNHWKIDQNSQKSSQVIAVLKFVVAMFFCKFDSSMESADFLLVSKKTKVHTELKNYTNFLVVSSYEASSTWLHK